jgi:hypothetical protein
MLSPIFSANDAVWIVAGGPSLRGFNFGMLDDANVIAVNKSFMNLPNARVIWWSDTRFWLWAQQFGWPLETHSAIKCCGSDHRSDVKYPPEINQFKFDGLKGLSLVPGYLRSGNNSAYAAANLAIQLGARRIRYLGLDMKLGDDGADHHYPSYPTGPIKSNTLSEKMLPLFETMVQPLRDIGAEVVNCNLDSAVTCFPKADFWEVFAGDNARRNAL